MRPITITRRADLQACTCESPVCPLAHAPVADPEPHRPHRAVVARIAAARRRATPIHHPRRAPHAWAPS